MKVIGNIFLILGILGLVGSITRYFNDKEINIYSLLIFIFMIGLGSYFISKNKREK